MSQFHNYLKPLNIRAAKRSNYEIDSA